jgi:hypothetical protein
MSQINGIFNQELAGKKNVVGAGYGFKNGGEEKAIVVLVQNKMPLSALSVEDIIPEKIRDIQTDVIEVGEIRVLPPQQVDPKGRFRPAPGGVSLGHEDITAGTFGAVVRINGSNERMILSNNHVLAKSNLAEIGDTILQPGAYDGGDPEKDEIARLYSFEPIDFTGQAECPVAMWLAWGLNALARLFGAAHRMQPVRTQQTPNIMDAALARPIVDGFVIDEILEIGVVEGITESTLGMRVRKYGRTTEYTEGNVVVMGATINVNYGEQGTAQFQNQVVTTPMSAGGDSGSLVLAADSLLAVGLLFAGSDQTMIYSPIAPILERFNAHF